MDIFKDFGIGSTKGDKINGTTNKNLIASSIISRGDLVSYDNALNTSITIPSASNIESIIDISTSVETRYALVSADPDGKTYVNIYKFDETTKKLVLICNYKLLDVVTLAVKLVIIDSNRIAAIYEGPLRYVILSLDASGVITSKGTEQFIGIDQCIDTRVSRMGVCYNAWNGRLYIALPIAYGFSIQMFSISNTSENFNPSYFSFTGQSNLSSGAMQLKVFSGAADYTTILYRGSNLQNYCYTCVDNNTLYNASNDMSGGLHIYTQLTGASAFKDVYHYNGSVIGVAIDLSGITIKIISGISRLSPTYVNYSYTVDTFANQTIDHTNDIISAFSDGYLYLFYEGYTRIIKINSDCTITLGAKIPTFNIDSFNILVACRRTLSSCLFYTASSYNKIMATDYTPSAIRKWNIAGIADGIAISDGIVGSSVNAKMWNTPSVFNELQSGDDTQIYNQTLIDIVNEAQSNNDVIKNKVVSTLNSKMMTQLSNDSSWADIINNVNTDNSKHWKTGSTVLSNYSTIAAYDYVYAFTVSGLPFKPQFIAFCYDNTDGDFSIFIYEAKEFNNQVDDFNKGSWPAGSVATHFSYGVSVNNDGFIGKYRIYNCGTPNPASIKVRWYAFG